MDKKKIKRIIARDGLIIIAIIAIGFIYILYIPRLIYPRPIGGGRDYYAEEIEHKPSPQYTRITSTEELNKVDAKQERVRTMGMFLIILGYPIYLLIRFIIWAIKTLKQKE